MTGRRLLGGAAAAGLVAALSAATAAHAQPSYPPTPPGLSVSATEVVVGGSVTLPGRNWLPFSTVTITSRVSDQVPEPMSSTGESEAGSAARPAGPAAIVPRQDRTDAIDGDDAAVDGGTPGVSERGYGGGRDHGRVCTIYRVCQVRADRRGDFRIRIVLAVAGKTTITAQGFDQDGRRVRKNVVVRVLPRRHHRHHHRHHHHKGGAEAGEPELPNTGAPVLGASAAGLGLLTAGGALVLVARRRRRTAQQR